VSREFELAVGVPAAPRRDTGGGVRQDGARAW